MLGLSLFVKMIWFMLIGMEGIGRELGSLWYLVCFVNLFYFLGIFILDDIRFLNCEVNVLLS